MGWGCRRIVRRKKKHILISHCCWEHSVINIIPKKSQQQTKMLKKKKFLEGNNEWRKSKKLNEIEFSWVKLINFPFIHCSTNIKHKMPRRRRSPLKSL